MKKFFLVTTMLLLINFTQSLIAQTVTSFKDAPFKDEPLKESFADWRGFYTGLNLGMIYGNGSFKTTTTYTPSGYFVPSDISAIASAGSQNFNAIAFNGGFQAGYNFQTHHIVYGLETDLGIMNFSGRNTKTLVYPCCSPATFTIYQVLKTTWLFTLRPRLGYAWGNTLLYGTGGYALTNASYESIFSDNFANAYENGQVNKKINGWAVGAGIQYAITTNLSLRGEYRYLGFGNVSATSNNLVAGTPQTAYPANVFNQKATLNTQLLSFAINYRI